MTPAGILRPVSVCASGREILDDMLGNKLTVIGLSAHRLERTATLAERKELRCLLDAVEQLEGFMRDLSPCRGCLKCTSVGVILDLEG